MPVVEKLKLHRTSYDRTPVITEQLQTAIDFAKRFRNGRSVVEVVSEEFAIHNLEDRHYIEPLSKAVIAVPDGPQALLRPEERQWTTSSLFIFLRPERVFHGEPIISPTSNFHGRIDSSHFALPPLLESVFEQIRESGKPFAAWSGPEPVDFYWNNYKNGLLYSPENIKRWRENLLKYFFELKQSFQHKDLKQRIPAMLKILEKLGISGFWQERQAGMHVVGNPGLLYDSLMVQARDLTGIERGNLPYIIEVEIRRMKIAYEKLLDEVGSEHEIELIKNAGPVLIPLKIPKSVQNVLFGFPILASDLMTDGFDDRSIILKKVNKRSPSWHQSWPRGIYPEHLDVDRPIIVDSSVTDIELAMIKKILLLWGLGKMQVKNLDESITFLDSCRVPYENHPYTYGDQVEDVRLGKLIPLFDYAEKYPHAVFSFAETNVFFDK